MENKDCINYSDLMSNIFGRLDIRKNWLEMISSCILEIDRIDRTTQLNDNFDSWYAFLPEELDPEYQWPFNVGDLVTDGKYIMKIENLPALDPRATSNYRPELVEEFGNRYYCTKIDKDGNDLEADDPVPYLHRKYNIDQIRLATQEDLDRIFSK
jgi:hypothetical protein